MQEVTFTVRMLSFQTDGGSEFGKVRPGICQSRWVYNFPASKELLMTLVRILSSVPFQMEGVVTLATNTSIFLLRSYPCLKTA